MKKIPLTCPCKNKSPLIRLKKSFICNNKNCNHNLETNSFPIFNDIPVIGDLLSGKEDEGLFAINYSAKGKWSEPDIIVNPLSILTPGIIRNIFD